MIRQFFSMIWDIFFLVYSLAYHKTYWNNSNFHRYGIIELCNCISNNCNLVFGLASSLRIQFVLIRNPSPFTMDVACSLLNVQQVQMILTDINRFSTKKVIFFFHFQSSRKDCLLLWLWECMHWLCAQVARKPMRLCTSDKF